MRFEVERELFVSTHSHSWMVGGRGSEFFSKQTSKILLDSYVQVEDFFPRPLVVNSTTYWRGVPSAVMAPTIYRVTPALDPILTVGAVPALSSRVRQSSAWLVNLHLSAGRPRPRATSYHTIGVNLQ